jgi:predicted DNA-binding transcriptional regulator AlpA
MSEAPEWLTQAKLAATLGVSTMTLWRWERMERVGFPAPTKINGRKYWKRSDIDEWMRERAVSRANQITEVA